MAVAGVGFLGLLAVVGLFGPVIAGIYLTVKLNGRHRGQFPGSGSSSGVLGIIGLVVLAAIAIPVIIGVLGLVSLSGTGFSTTASAEASPVGSGFPIPVDQGAETALLPDLTGLQSSEAEQLLADAGLAVTIRRQPGGAAPDGEVLAQDPTAGSTVPLHSVVTLTISVGPTPSTVAAPSPTR